MSNKRKPRLSLSGKERNHLFLKGADSEFHDVSGLSGLDSSSDGRSIAVFDFDNDGFQDFLVANANAPLLSIYRNRTSEIGGSKNFISVKLVGGNDMNLPNSEYSNRDAIGARITVAVAGKRLVQQLSGGEGLAAQNQAERRFGLGQHEAIDSIDVVWPSGKTQTINETIARHSKVTIFEEPRADQEKYSVDTVNAADIMTADRGFGQVLNLSGLEVENGKIAIVTSMATWCPNCKSHLPELARLQQQYSGQIVLFAVSMDRVDAQKKLQMYVQANQPPYKLLPGGEGNAATFVEYVVSEIGSAKLPSTIIVGSGGKVMQVLPSVPTVSDIERLGQHSLKTD